FLSMARTDGVNKARTSLLPVGTDQRVPMPALYAFYKGKIKPETVLAAVNAGSPSIDEMTSRLCYAHFYLGHYYAVNGDDSLARERLTKASAVTGRGNLFGELARVTLKEEKPPAKP